MGCVRVKMVKPLVITVLAVAGALGAAGGVVAVDQSVGPPDVVLPVAADGHFWAQGSTDDGSVRLLVDTGATRVSLTRDDAERLGVSLADDAFTQNVLTPGGETPVAVVTLPWLAVGSVRLENVEAVVFEQGLGHSLLGMSFLGRLDGYGVSSGSMRLRS